MWPEYFCLNSSTRKWSLGARRHFDSLVADQLPSGWDPLNYGIPEDIVSHVDPITLYMLCCLSQALLSAGIDDAFEIDKYFNISELANCIGTGAGGLKSMRGVYRDRYIDRTLQNDILQEIIRTRIPRGPIYFF